MSEGTRPDRAELPRHRFARRGTWTVSTRLLYGDSSYARTNEKHSLPAADETSRHSSVPSEQSAKREAPPPSPALQPCPAHSPQAFSSSSSLTGTAEHDASADWHGPQSPVPQAISPRISARQGHRRGSYGGISTAEQAISLPTPFYCADAQKHRPPTTGCPQTASTVEGGRRHLPQVDSEESTW